MVSLLQMRSTKEAMFENKDNPFILRLDGFEEQWCIQMKIPNRVLNIGICTLGEGVYEAHQEMTKTTALVKLSGSLCSMKRGKPRKEHSQ